MIEDNYDHKNKTLIDRLDESENSFLTYTCANNKISSSCRVYWNEVNLVAEQDRKKYFLDDLPLEANTRISISERLAIIPNKRAKYLAVIQTAYCASRLIRDLGTYFNLASCAPGLLKHYMKLGYRPYTTHLIQFDDRVEIPIVVMPDLPFLKKVKSIAYPMMKKYADKALIRKFENYRPDILDNYMTENKTISDIDVGSYLKYKKSFMYHLKTETINFLIKNSFFLDVKKGSLLFSEKEHHQERYIVLNGEFGLSKHNKVILSIYAGDIIGEFGTYHDNYLRHVSVQALQDSRVIVVPRGIEKKLFKTDPKLYMNFMESYTKSIAIRERKIIVKLVSSFK